MKTIKNFFLKLLILTGIISLEFDREELKEHMKPHVNNIINNF